MRVIPFPSRDEVQAEERWLAELEESLSGTAEGLAAQSWRELRADVRSLSPPPRAEFAVELEQRLAASRAPRMRQRRRGILPSWLGARPQLAGALTGVLALLVAAVAIVGPWRSGTAGRVPVAVPHGEASTSAGAAIPKSTMAPAPAIAPTQAGEGSIPTYGSSGRVQQHAAAITLTAAPSQIQSVADGVTRVVGSAGGFVRSSHVQVQREGSSSAELTLSVPSAKLTSILAVIGRLAPVQSESQSLQDITNSYNAARQRLSDVTAERQALLRALAAATTQGQIDSLRERLSGVGRAIAGAQRAVQGLSRQASNSEVEVTVAGAARSAREGSTLHRGLHDAGKVLLVTLSVLLIGAAVLVPLMILLTLIIAAHRALRRYWRERVLEAR